MIHPTASAIVIPRFNRRYILITISFRISVPLSAIDNAVPLFLLLFLLSLSLLPILYLLARPGRVDTLSDLINLL